MINILQRTYSKCIFLKPNMDILNLWFFVAESLIDKENSISQAITWVYYDQVLCL